MTRRMSERMKDPMNQPMNQPMRQPLSSATRAVNGDPVHLRCAASRAGANARGFTLLELLVAVSDGMDRAVEPVVESPGFAAG